MTAIIDKARRITKAAKRVAMLIVTVIIRTMTEAGGKTAKKSGRRGGNAFAAGMILADPFGGIETFHLSEILIPLQRAVPTPDQGIRGGLGKVRTCWRRVNREMGGTGGRSLDKALAPSQAGTTQNRRNMPS